MIGFSNALRLELADSNVYVTTINPGPIATSFFDKADPSGEYLKSVGRFVLQPEELLFLNFNYTFTEKIYTNHNEFESYHPNKELRKKYIHIQNF